eukprot:4889089-Prymnesium_polylepis.1
MLVLVLASARAGLHNDINDQETRNNAHQRRLASVFERSPLGKASPACNEPCTIPGAGCGSYLTVPLREDLVGLSNKQVERRAKQLKWVHDIELRPGIRSSKFAVTPVWNQDHIVAAFPDVRGKTVLELGS